MRTFRIVAALALLVAAGVVHGAWTHRWKPSRAVEQFAARLDAVPLTLGDWQGVPFEMDERELAAGGAEGHLTRRYRDVATGRTVTAFVICNLPLQATSHVPEICYAGGYELSEPTRTTVRVGSPPRPATLLTFVARRDGPDGPEALRLYWAWNDGSGWNAPDEPRWAYVGAPALFKLYLIRDALGDRDDTDVDVDPSLAFLDAFAPVFDEIIFAPDRAGD